MREAFRRRTRPSSRLQVEALENRCCPSTVTFHGATLLVQGDDAANNIAITDDGQGNISATVDGQTVTGTGIRNVVVHGRRGNDIVSYTLTGALSTAHHLNLHLGDGDDQVNFDFSPGLSSRLKVNLHGGDGNDQVTATFGAVTGGNLFFNSNLGKGDDQLDVTFAGMLSQAARARFHVHGHMGNDTMAFHATGVDIADTSVLAIFLKGGKDDDHLSVDYQGVLAGTLLVRLDGDQGTDTSAANLNAAAGSTGEVRALVKGGQGNDQLTLNVNDQSATPSSLGVVFALIDGGQGEDDAFHTADVLVRRCETDTLTTPPTPTV